MLLRKWSSITGRAEGYKTGKKGGGADGKTLSHAEGTKRFEVVLTWELEVLAILKGAQNVSTH